METRCQALLDGVRAYETADSYAVRIERSTVSFEANRLESIRSTMTRGSGLRVLIDERLGYAGGTDHVAAESLSKDAIELARFGPRVTGLELPGPGATPPRDPPRFFEGTAELSTDDLAERCEEVVDRILSVRDDVNVDVEATRSTASSLLANSHGLRYASESSLYSLGLTIKRSHSGEILYCSAGASVRDHESRRAQPEPLCEEALAQLSRCDKSAEIETGDYPVIFTGSGIYGLLVPLLMGLDGEALSKGISPLSQDRESRHFSPGFRLRSDPTIEGALANRALDGDGLALEPLDLVAGGRVENGLFDRVTAAKWRMRFPEQADWARSGSARRTGFGGNASPGHATLVLDPGSESDLLSGVERGVLIERLLGVQMGNPISGEFSNNVYIGHLVENGQVVGRVKDLMVAGSVYEALDSIEAIGDTPEWVGDRLLLPPVRVGRLRVTSKS
jgi:PmbA protein